MRTNRRTFAAAEIKPRSYLEPLDVRTIFGREARLEVDLGCGDGTFLVALAQRSPETNFIGVERLPGRFRSAGRKIGEAGLTNARVLEHDILHAVQQLFAPGSVDVFSLLFPDPWPKRRHQRRRIFGAAFLRAIDRALRPEGELRIATDHPEYFAQIRMEAESFASLVVIEPEKRIDAPTTTFEKRFRRRGRAIHRLTLRKVSPERSGMDPTCRGRIAR